jgi:hypothetical protein
LYKILTPAFRYEEESDEQDELGTYVYVSSFVSIPIFPLPFSLF